MVRSFVLQWPYFIISMVLVLGVCDQAINSNITVAISRRVLDDISYICKDTSDLNCHNLCSSDSATYLVAGKQCVNNSDLFNECSLAITPTGEPHMPRLAIKILTGTSQSRLQTFNGTSTLDANIIRRSTEDQVNYSVCHISSLEVYRGRKQVIEISYNGFSLSDSGTIEIHEDRLTYDPTEYVGELYRMNLTCMYSPDVDGTRPPNNCLFFKVAGYTIITAAKFNCTVPGTVHDISECEQRTMAVNTNASDLETTAPQSSSPIPIISTEKPQVISVSNIKNRALLEIGTPLFYGLVAAGSAVILILLLCLIGVSVFACWRGCNTSHTEKHGQPIYEDLDNRNGQIAITNPGYNNNPDMNGHSTSGDSVMIAEQDFTSHTYQEIGATYQEIMPMAKDSNQLKVQWVMQPINPNSFQLKNSRDESSQEYSTLNHAGGQKALDHSNAKSTTIDSEQYAKLNQDSQ